MLDDLKPAEKIPRDFYDGVTSIREAFLDFDVEEDIVEEALDQIEDIIAETVRDNETTEDAEDEGDSSN